MSDIRVLVVDDDFMVARLHSSVVARQPGFAVAGVAAGTTSTTATSSVKGSAWHRGMAGLGYSSSSVARMAPH